MGLQLLPPLGEVAAGDGITVETIGDTATVGVGSSVLRDTERGVGGAKTVGQYYLSSYGPLTTATAMTLQRLVLIPVVLAPGTLDRIGLEVTTGVASNVARLGVYLSDTTALDKPGVTNSLIAEAASTIDCSTTGVKEATISAVIPSYDLYWFGVVLQGGSVATLRCVQAASGGVHMPLGTALPAVTTTPNNVRHQSSIAGALPSGLTISETSLDPAAPRVIYRYSA